MATKKKFFTIGEAAERCGVATPTLRFYEKKTLNLKLETLTQRGLEAIYLTFTCRSNFSVRVPVLNEKIRSPKIGGLYYIFI